MTILAPIAANRSEATCPIPEVAPVNTMTLPCMVKKYSHEKKRPLNITPRYSMSRVDADSPPKVPSNGRTA